MISCQKGQIVTVDVQEQIEKSRLSVEGQIPSWLSGTLIRNGPVNVTVGTVSNRHWFDGLAMLHVFSFERGEISYQSRFLRTEAYSQVFENSSLDYKGFAVDPCRSLFKQFLTFLMPRSEKTLYNANVNIAKIADHYVALTEYPLPVEFDKNTLMTLGVFNYKDALPKKNIWESAHPHHSSQEYINYLIQYGPKSYYLLYSLDETRQKREVIAKLAVQNPAYMHSFALTQNYIILTEFPFTIKPLKLLLNTQLQGKSFIQNFSWNPEQGTNFIVIDRASGKQVGAYKTEAFFAFHHVNAFEKGNALILDLVCYANPSIIDGLKDHFRTSKSEEDKFTTQLKRFYLDLTKGSIDSEVLLDAYLEFPRICEKNDSQAYRFVYLVDPRQPSSAEDLRPIYKVNVDTKEVLLWQEKGCYPGEALFIAHPEKQQEDSGVVVSIVLDPKNNSSFLLILEGKSFQEIARVRIQENIPVGLHGQFFIVHHEALSVL